MSETLIHLVIITATLQLLEKPAVVSCGLFFFTWGVEIRFPDILLQPESPGEQKTRPTLTPNLGTSLSPYRSAL